MDTDNLGRILKERRRSKDWTLAQLSSMSGVCSSHIGRIERGERNPSAHVLRKLAEPLSFSEMKLFRLAGLISEDEVADRLERFKGEIKREIAHLLVSLYKKVDNYE